MSWEYIEQLILNSDEKSYLVCAKHKPVKNVVLYYQNNCTWKLPNVCLFCEKEIFLSFDEKPIIRMFSHVGLVVKLHIIKDVFIIWENKFFFQYFKE